MSDDPTQATPSPVPPPQAYPPPVAQVPPPQAPPIAPVAPQIVYQQKPFPWMILSQVVLVVLLLVVLRKEFMGPAASSQQVQPQSASEVFSTYEQTSKNFRVLAEKITTLQGEISSLKQEKKSNIILYKKQESLLQAKMVELVDYQKEVAVAVKETSENTTRLEGDLETLSKKHIDTHRRLEKLSVRVLARQGLSPATANGSKSTKNRLVGYKATPKAVVKPAEPTPTKKTPRIVRSHNSDLAVGSVGVPPIPDFASQWMKEWNEKVSKKTNNLKRREFIYKMLSHPQSKQGTLVYLKALDDKDPVVRRFAVTALKDITGKDFGYSPSAPREQRLQGMREWKAALTK